MMDGAAQRMLENHRRRGEPGIFAGILLALAVSALPMYDACGEAEVAQAFAGAGFGGGSSASALGPCVLWLAIAIAIVFGLSKAFAVRGLALMIVVVAGIYAGVMICRSSAMIARTRSHAVDSWPTCDGSGRSGAVTYGRTSFDGPHSADGEPCVEESEARRDHARAHPGGDLSDGIHQILYRFRDDQLRVIYLPVLLLLGLLAAVVLTIVAERRRIAVPEPPK
jgi:hypothetical protein